MPLVAILAMVTIIGAPFGLAILLMVWPAAAFAGYLVAGIWIGEWLLYRGDLPRPERPYMASVLGLIVLQIIGLVPFVTPIASLFGFGAVLLLAWRTFDSRARERSRRRRRPSRWASDPRLSDRRRPADRPGAPAVCPQPGDDVVHDLGALGLVVEFVAKTRIRPALDQRSAREDRRADGRDEPVVLAVDDQRRDPEATRGAPRRTRRCSASASAPKRVVLTLTHSGSWTVFAATDGSRDSVPPSMPFGIAASARPARAAGASRFFQPGSAESRAGAERTAKSGFGRSSAGSRPR